MKLNNKVAIITGGASGIGRQTCLEMAKEGAKIVIGDLNESKGSEVVDCISKIGSEAIFVKVDQTNTEDIDRLIDHTKRHFGQLDVLFSNAGIGEVKPLLDLDAEEWQRTINVNLNGTFYMCQAAAKEMIKQKNGGSIIITSSIGALVPINWFGAYNVSKAGVLTLAKSLAMELGNYRIRVNAILPGIVETPMSKAVLNKERHQRSIKATIPLGRWAKTEEVSNAVTFLASDDASYINGQSITIDGGWSNASAFQWFPLDYTNDNEINWRTEVKYNQKGKI